MSDHYEKKLPCNNCGDEVTIRFKKGEMIPRIVFNDDDKPCKICGCQTRSGWNN